MRVEKPFAVKVIGDRAMVIGRHSGRTLVETPVLLTLEFPIRLMTDYGTLAAPMLKTAPQPRHVCLAPDNGLKADVSARLFRANNSHSAASLDHLVGAGEDC